MHQHHQIFQLRQSVFGLYSWIKGPYYFDGTVRHSSSSLDMTSANNDSFDPPFYVTHGFESLSKIGAAE